MAAAVRICLCFKSLQSLTAAALFGRSKWRESGEGASKMVLGASGVSDQAAGDIADFVKSNFGGLKDL